MCLMRGSLACTFNLYVETILPCRSHDKPTTELQHGAEIRIFKRNIIKSCITFF